MPEPKLDLKKRYKALFTPSSEAFEVIEVPPLHYLMIDGAGNPNGPAYVEALEALYPLAYTLKFFSKLELGRDYGVPPLQALWWADDMSAFVRRDKEAWKWTAMLLTPEWVTAAHVQQARETVRRKKKSKAPPALDRVRLEAYDEGLSVQILHLGSYDDETETLRRLHEEFLPEQGLVETGKHHEIYLNDPRKTAPEKLKTVLRQPVRAR